MRKFFAIATLAGALIAQPALANQCGGSPVWKGHLLKVTLHGAAIESQLAIADRDRLKTYVAALDTVTVSERQIDALESFLVTVKPYLSAAEFKQVRGDIYEMIGTAYAVISEHGGSLVLADASLEASAKRGS